MPEMLGERVSCLYRLQKLSFNYFTDSERMISKIKPDEIQNVYSDEISVPTLSGTVIILLAQCLVNKSYALK